MSDEIKMDAELITDEKLEQVAGGRKKGKKAEKTKYHCSCCAQGFDIGHTDNSIYIWRLGNEGYCTNGHYYSTISPMCYCRYDVIGSKKWFSEHR